MFSSIAESCLITLSTVFEATTDDVLLLKVLQVIIICYKIKIKIFLGF